MCIRTRSSMMTPLRAGLPFSDEALSLISLMLWLGRLGRDWLPLLRCLNLTSRCAFAMPPLEFASLSFYVSVLVAPSRKYGAVRVVPDTGDDGGPDRAEEK